MNERNIISIQTSKGEKIPVIDMFPFRYRKTVSTTTYWECLNKRCPVILKMTKIRSYDVSNTHNHEPDFEYVYKSIFRTIFKEIIKRDPFLSSSKIYNEAINKFGTIYGFSSSAMTLIPGFESYETIIYREKHKFYPSNSSLMPTIIQPEMFKLVTGQSILLYSDMLIDRMIILGELQYIARFAISNDFEIYMDGTFKSSSEDFYQLYIIHSRFEGQSFPLIYVFLSGKTVEDYRMMLERIRLIFIQHGFHFKPTLTQIDFEPAVYRALKATWNDITVRGCYFHFGQAIWRKVVELGLKTRFLQEEEVKFPIQLISTLPLVPLEDLENAWLIILSFFRFVDDEKIEELCEYVERNWMLDRESIFNPTIWNHFLNTGARTNNSLEGLHSKINRTINKSKPSFYEIIETIKL